MQNLYLFFIASLLLNLTPGNDMIYVISRTLSQGFKGGIYSALGVFAGCFVHILAAVFGLSFIIAKSVFVFELIKYIGAAYLIYLGITAILSKKKDYKNENIPKINKLTLFKQGVLTNALNPKVAIFFISFLPQFVNTDAMNIKMQLLTLGVWFAAQGTLILILVAFIVSKTGNIIKRHPRFQMIQEKITGFILIALGLKVAFMSKK